MGHHDGRYQQGSVGVFINVIKTGGQPRCDGYQGRRSVNLVQAVYQSTRTGQPVDVHQS